MSNNIFDEKNKREASHSGEIFKFGAYTKGSKFAGTYLGSHQWATPNLNVPGTEKMVTTYDFAAVTIDGVVQPRNKQYAINGFATLSKGMEQVVPGQVIGLEYAGKSVPKPGKQPAHLVTFYIDPANVDPNWRELVGATDDEPVSTAAAFAPPAGQAVAAPSPTFGFGAAAPFGATPAETHAKIMQLIAGKGLAANEEAAKSYAMQTTGLPYADANLVAIYGALVAKVGA